MANPKRKRPLSPSEKQRQKVFKPSTLPRVSSHDIVLIEGKQNQKNLKYWHIYYQTLRVGKVFIAVIREKAMITVEINKKYQGMGIGRAAFRKASELSQFDEVFALIRKSNAASIKAVQFAGFHLAGTENGQLLYKWKRNEK